MAKIKENEAAIVFSPKDIRFECPEMEDDVVVPNHILAATCVFVLLNEHGDTVKPLLHRIRQSILNS